MEFNPNDMKSIMEAIEHNSLNEAPLGQKIKNGITRAKAALGQNKAKGQVDSIELANKMEKAWEQWLGRSGKEGDINDIVSFLSSNLVGFSLDDAKKIVSSFSGPIVNGNNNSNQETEKVEPTLNQNENPKPEPAQKEEPQQQEEPETEQENAASQERTDADDIVDQNINVLNTYMNKKYLSNMTNDVASKMENAIKNIVKNLPYSNEETIKKGANTAWDAVASLENAGVINYALSGSIQKYLNKILNTGKAEGNPYVYVTPDGKTGDDKPLNAAAPHVPKAKPINTGTPNGETAKPKFKVKAGSNRISESKLSSSETYKIFQAAANYAYSNELVSGVGNANSMPSSVPSGNSYQSPNSQSDDIKTDKQMTRYIDKVLQQCAANGVNGSDFSDLRSMARQNQFENIVEDDDKRALAAIGYAFLKSI